MPLWNVAYMWANLDVNGKSRGEGIFAPYSFRKYHTYKIAIRYMGVLQLPGQPTNARIELHAAQDIIRPGTWKFGNLTPHTVRSQNIGMITTDAVTGWKQSPEFIFTADYDFNEFWIFPHTTISNQYNLFIDWAQVCREECLSIIYYKQGTLPVAEPRFGSIYIGTSYGGTGTVTVSPTAQTTVIAANEIIIKPVFAATVTTGSFIARIQPGGCNIVYNRPNQDQDTSTVGLPVEYFPFVPGESTYFDEYGVAERPNPNNVKTVKDVNSKVPEGMLAYPNPVQGKLNIDFNSAKEGKIRIRVLNALGIVKHQMIGTVAMKTNHFEIDTKTLPKGLYFIQIFDVDGKVTVKKILVSN